MTAPRRRSRSRRPSVCGRCQAPLLVWRNAKTEDTMLRLDLSPDETGTVRKVIRTVDGQDRAFGYVLTPEQRGDAIASGELLFVLHSTTCTAHRAPNPRPDHVRVELANREDRG
ncbi:MAG: hypothetical protein INR72_15545 [Williamsia herbipolensis]|nr:hypothetical protein [Williamsia herbipolensis]